MIVKRDWRKGGEHHDHIQVLTEELEFLLETLKHERQIDTIIFHRLLHEPGMVFVGLRSRKFQRGFGSGNMTEKDLSYIKRRFKNKTFIEI